MMENTENDLEKFLQESFKDFEVEPSDAVWKAVEQNLPPKNDWKKPAILLLLLFLISGIGWFFVKNSEKNERKLTE